MRRLCSLLGMPQRRFAAIHVVGSNGKTSVTRMASALLTSEGISTGAYLSPHIRSWRERLLIGPEPIAEPAFERALERTEEAARIADRAAADEGPVTQFELLTAAAFLAFAEARVEVAVVEAGLGGRLDATNVIASRVTALTSVSLEHTEWLGETLAEIAAEKLAVLRDHSVLVLGPVPAEVRGIAAETAARRHAKLVEPQAPPEGLSGLVPDGYPATNLSVAAASAEALLGRRLSAAPDAELGERLAVPGRAELLPGDPPLVLDAAHNGEGAAALARVLPGLAGGRPVVCCFAALEDKDVGEMVTALAPRLSAAVCTELPAAALADVGRPGARSAGAAKIAGAFERTGVAAEAEPELERALERGRALAGERGQALLVTGSHYLLAAVSELIGTASGD